MQDSTTSSELEVSHIPRLIQTLRNSNNREEILESIEDLRAISRGDGP